MDQTHSGLAYNLTKRNSFEVKNYKRLHFKWFTLLTFLSTYFKGNENGKLRNQYENMFVGVINNHQHTSIGMKYELSTNRL